MKHAPFISLMQRLRRDRSGVAMLEFALSMPFLLMVGLWGAELANYTIINMRVSQLAQQIADNASRIGETALVNNRKIYEADIYDLLQGAHLQGGDRMGLYDNGRVIISSLEEFNDGDHCLGATCRGGGSLTDGTQFISWQRCLGTNTATPAFGVENDEMPGGIGPTGRQVEALPDTPVIFVEVTYEYQPLVSARFVGTPTISSYASYLVRDNRDLRNVYLRSTSPSDPVADCGTFDNPFA